MTFHLAPEIMLYGSLTVIYIVCASLIRQICNNQTVTPDGAVPLMNTPVFVS